MLMAVLTMMALLASMLALATQLAALLPRMRAVMRVQPLPGTGRRCCRT